MENPKLELGDYVQFVGHGDDHDVYEVVGLDNYPRYVSVTLVHPIHLAQQMKKYGIFSILLETYNIKVLGNPKKDSFIKALYG